MRPVLVPGRWPGSAFAAVGVLLAVPTVVWPVVIIGYAPPDEGGYSGSPFGQGIWSWGKYSQLGAETNSSVFEMSNTAGLVFLIVSLVVGVGSALAWGVVEGMPGAALGLAGTCLAAAAQLSSLSQWAGQQLSDFYPGDNGIGVEVRTAGWLQLASAVMFVVAIGFMLWRPLRAWLVPTFRRLTGGAPGSTDIPVVARDGESSPHPIGPARMQEADRAGEPSRPVTGPTVSFSDEVAGDHRARGSEPSR
ncbi:MAG: hypothetical protein L0H96_16965 [Humibacillus sp.]|nr:hypothetical protein [Humibacillus sp.]MDN5778588.1 hypothetical protein [Humibacillus sp.]